MDPAITIRPVESIAELLQVEELQRVVWPGNETEIIPLHMLQAVAHNGGVLLGAFDGERMAGFVFGFLGTDTLSPDRVAMARLKHCSHQLGVLPDYRQRGVGTMLKLAQREAVIDQGIRLATWTYDPLMSPNAHLNIRRLGAVCRTYLRNVYGDLRDDLNRGLPSDRFMVEWWVTSPRVTARLDGSRGALDLAHFLSSGATLINTVASTDDGLPQPSGKLAALVGTFLMVEIPSDFLAIKDKDPQLALSWRLHSREIFELAFAAGYMVTDFVHVSEDREQRSYYLLSHGEAKLG